MPILDKKCRIWIQIVENLEFGSKLPKIPLLSHNIQTCQFYAKVVKNFDFASEVSKNWILGENLPKYRV